MEEKHQSYQSSLLSLEIEQHMADVEIIADVHDTKEQTSSAGSATLGDTI